MPIIKITRETIDEYYKLYSEGKSQMQSAEILGVNLESIRKACDRLGIEWKSRHKEGVKSLVEAELSGIDTTKQTQAEWAREFGVSQSRMHHIFKELKLKSRYTKPPGKRTNYRRDVENCRQVIGYITTNGGCVKHAIQHLGLKTTQAKVRQYASSIGFNLDHYRYAYEEYGEWITLPGPYTRQGANITVQALCRECGEVYPLALPNARSGRSRKCMSCSTRDRVFRQVLHVETGKLYKSIMSWARDIGCLNEYQQLRVRLKEGETLEVKGQTYRLV